MTKSKPNSSIDDNHESEWLLSRSKFVKTLVLSGLAIQLPWLTSCSSEEEIIKNCSPLTEDQFKSVRAVQDILFPDDGNGPSARDINAASYLVWVLNDSFLDPEENTYLFEKIDKLEAYSKMKYNSFFHSLSLGNQEEMIASINKESWGNKFLSRLITLIMEALLLDPAYGSNTDEMGWEWLNHNPGQPRPTTKILYPEIFKNR